MFSKITLALAVAVAGLAGLAAPQSASANDYGSSSYYCTDHHVCTYETITTYVYKRVAYKHRVVEYYPCGTPYYVWHTHYKTVRVPVYTRIRTCHHH